MVGARGFNADYALLVTWERMGYGGAPKTTDLNMYETVKRWVRARNAHEKILFDVEDFYSLFSKIHIK